MADDLAPVFSRIAPVRGHEEVALQIREAILSERLLPSDRLPSSRQLAQQFGVSRALVHEALRVLEHSGLVVTRPGAHGGTFVRRPDADQVTREVGVLIRTGGVSLSELSELRTLLEGQNAAWAARRASPEQLAELSRITREMRHLATSGDVKAGQVEDLDVQFHTLIARAGGNGLSAAIVIGIVPALRHLIGLLPPHSERSAATQYEKCYAAITEHSETRARSAMVDHINFYANVLTEGSGG
jgi:GntR family transcriptional regulator, transcriptional repressor for pyruvate dehydrogenase complex